MPDRRLSPALAVGLALVLGLAGLSASVLLHQILFPRPVLVAGLVLDRLSASLSLLVAAVGAICYRFSLLYLEGDPARRPFLIKLALTVLSAYVLMLANHLILLFAAWLLTGLGLHALLTHEAHRPEAIPPARKKFLISRLGDLALLAAITLIGTFGHTLEITTFLRNPPTSTHPAALSAVAVLITLAALTKSAQFPFHSWLPETMEAPTPVSALMHAGIINAGGALLLRFAPLLVQSPTALLLLALIGTLTTTLGLLALWSQVLVKRTLAWSTVAQMGFMMIQAGLSAFPAAWLHLLGHGLYKAHAFLRSGQLPPPSRPQSPIPPARALGLIALGTLLSIPVLALAARLTGFSPSESPGELALSAILALSLGQLWVALLGRSSRPLAVASALLGTVLIPPLAFALYQAAALFLAPVLGPLPWPSGPLAWLSALLPVSTLSALSLLHAVLPALAHRPLGRALHVHALNGFYLGTLADRLVLRIWTRLPQIQVPTGVKGA